MISVRIKGEYGTIEISAKQDLIYNPNYRKYEPVETLSGALSAAIRAYKELTNG